MSTDATTHTLELREPFWTDMLEGRKTFDVRQERPDRRFSVGDALIFLHADDPAQRLYTTVRYVSQPSRTYAAIPHQIRVLGLAGILFGYGGRTMDAGCELD